MWIHILEYQSFDHNIHVVGLLYINNSVNYL